LSKQNYRHAKKQKEHARKARQAEKQQRRQVRANPDAPTADGLSAEAAQAPNGGLDGAVEKS